MKIAFFYNTKTTWTLKDLEILTEKHEVHPIFTSSLKETIKFVVTRKPSEYDLYFFWFASFSFYPAFLMAKILRKKIVTVAGGFDVAAVPSIGFGAYARGSLSKFFRSLFFKLSDKVLAVSHSNYKETLVNTKISKNKLEMIYHGFKCPVEPLKPWVQRKNRIITIGQVTLENTMVKGHKAFCDLARLMPEYEFVLIGRSTQEGLQYLKAQEIPNLKVTGFLPDAEFNELLNDSKIYLQLSHHEGFGCSVVDAALMGIYPIVYDVYALPEVVEGMGSVASFGNLSQTSRLITTLISNQIDANQVRSFYLEKFPFNRRKEHLLEVIENV